MTKSTTKNKQLQSEAYNDDSVGVLLGLEGIRQRYHMYLGNNPIMHSIHEILDNSIDEVLNGYADEIVVRYNSKNNDITITDNGRGLPNGHNKKMNKNNIEVLCTQLHSGAKFDGNNEFKTAGGQNGVGLKGVCAMSNYLKVTSERDDGTRRWMEFSKGKVTSKKVNDEKPTGKHGTEVYFVPDTELLGEKAIIDTEALKETCKLRTYLNKGIYIYVYIDKDKYVYHTDNGVYDYIADNLESPLFGMKPTLFEGEIEGNQYSISFAFSSATTDESIKSFCNSIITSRGTHETGFKRALTNVFSSYIKDNNMLNKKDANLEIKGDDIRKGLKCIISVKIAKPEYSGQTKDELGNKEVISQIIKIMNDNFEVWIQENETLMKKLCTRVIQFARATESARKAQDKIVKNNGNSNLTFSNKYTECTSNDPDECEIILCEGKSAGGSIKRGRDARTQAIYALKGKILNTIGVTHTKMLSNDEINELLLILFGTNDFKLITIDKIKFKKIIILTDSDSDGLHIASLLIAFFSEHLPEVIEKGYLYIGLGPLYRITVNGKYIYFKNDNEYDAYKVKYLSERYSIHSEKLNMKYIVNNTEKYLKVLNNILSLYSLNKEILNVLISDELTLAKKRIAKEFKLAVKGNYVQGLYGEDWIDFEITDELMEKIDNLKKIMKNQITAILENKKTKEVFECDMLDLVEFLNNEFKFTRYRFKGLGEINPEELGETTLKAENRDLIQVRFTEKDADELKEEEIKKAKDEARDFNILFFGNKTEKRKDFIQKSIVNQ